MQSKAYANIMILITLFILLYALYADSTVSHLWLWKDRIRAESELADIRFKSPNVSLFIKN